MTADPALRALDLYRFFHTGDDETLALRGVSLELDRGEVVAVTGPSGSGKSTLIACLAGLDEPDGGTVAYGTASMTRRSEVDRAALRAQLVGVLFQSGNLLDHLTVEQNITVAQRLAGRARPAERRDLLARVDLSDRAAASPLTLSGGEAARAGLAVALANDPAVILADEPTGEIDEASADRLLVLLRSRARAGAAVLVVTHDPSVAAAADRRIELVDGRVATGGG
ncbi:ABC transporter ATP-binding protein [Aquihabitans sp. McL0605]|uniref:ABC transporter ATP-binding protein n=1 Tax=Aquihabitans sp. McL0605 TaxID=3415671 RepID=UPI003CF72EC8